MKLSLGKIIDMALMPFAPLMAAQRARARLEYRFITHKERQLSVYEAAVRDRTNRDWNPRRGSADWATLSDFDVLLNRNRSLQRDNWAARSIIGAFGRNVIGRGILPIWCCVDAQGNEKRDFNKRLSKKFLRWAVKKRFCDVAQSQTFFAKLKMAVEEMVAVGEHFIVWSYKPNPDSVGLQLQSFEPEQLDIFKIQEPTTGNYLRRGIEVDDYGAPVAYHFYKRPLNDWFPFLPAGVTGSIFTASERIPAERVMHLRIQERTRSSHGVGWLVSVSNKLRNVVTTDDALVMAYRLEASIIAVINRNDAGSGNPYEGAATSLPPRQGLSTDSAGNPVGDPTIPDTTTRDGGRQWPIEPALTFDGLPGETVTFPTRNGPGAQYDPFMTSQLRGSAAGSKLGYDVVARDYDKGNYNSKRLGQLEDRREYRTIQDVVVDEVVGTVAELFTRFAIMEDSIDGRHDLGVDILEFMGDPDDFAEIEYIPDGWDYMDEVKGATAASILLDKRLDTRKRLIASRLGSNFRDIFHQLAVEAEVAEEEGITLPDIEPQPPADAGDGPVPEDGEQPPGEAGEDPAEPEEDGHTPQPRPAKRGTSSRHNGHRRGLSSDDVIAQVVRETIRN